MKIRHRHVLPLWFMALSLACAAQVEPEPDASAVLMNRAGTVVGHASIYETPAGARVRVEVDGVAPGAHGIHIHAIGICDSDDAFLSAGGHFNPHGKEHGRRNPAGWHGGDLPNLLVDGQGRGTLDAVAEHLTLSDGLTSLFDADGSALVLHENEDDELTDSGPLGPGNSGSRIACGVIVRR